MGKEVEYFSKDFEWGKLKEEVESNPSLSYHFQSFDSNLPSLPSPSQDSQAWNQFHIRHSTGRFFKERRYLLKEFPELLSCDEYSKVLEVGCGNGSTALPILRGRDNIIIYACDCSNEALERANGMIDASNVGSVTHRFHPFHCDFSTNGFPKWLACDSCQGNFLQKQHDQISDLKGKKGTNLNDLSSLGDSKCCIGGVDFVTLASFFTQNYTLKNGHQTIGRATCMKIFTLSAVPPHRMPTAIRECFSVLKPGGLLLFRDYGLYDMTMLRFEPDQRVGFREYMRSDGTRSYFFCMDTVRDLFTGSGFTELELEYCCVKSTNRRNRKTMRRVWVHGKFQKPF